MKKYVSMTDEFMSGWGMAKNKINKLVLECDNDIEARRVKRHAESRREMKNINIRSSRPKYSKDKYYTSYKTKNDYPTWYR